MKQLKNQNASAKVPHSPQNRANALIPNKLGAKLGLKRDKIGTSSVPIFDSTFSDSLLSGQEPEKKKMFFAPIAGIHYREAKLTQGREWFISFYVIDPVSGKLKRVRIKCNRERNARLRKKNALQMVAGINQRLSMGWNPLSESVTPNAAEPLLKCIDGFLKIKRKETETASYRCYESFVKIFKKFLEDNKFPSTALVSSFTRQHALAFMDMVEENLSPKTFNNYIGFFRGLWTWMMEKGYADANPFDGIEKKPKKLLKKNRRLLTDDELKRLIDYLRRENVPYLAMCMLCYACFIRPKEIALLRCRDIDLGRQVVHVSAEIAKNDNDSFRTIPDEIMPVLRKLDLSNPDNYAFADHKMWDYTPGKQLMCSRKIAKYWELVLRKELGFGMDLKFYSLKDTGITNMLTNGVPINLVQRQADHSSVAMTAIYVGKRADASGELKHAEILGERSLSQPAKG